MTIDVLKTLPNDSKYVNGTVPVRPSVRRSLFGKVNHEESMEFLKKEIKSIEESQKKRWNFDFKTEKPLEPYNYEWTPVKPNDIIPRPYALSRLPYLYEHSENNTNVCDKYLSSSSPSPTESQCKSQVTISKTKLKQTLIDGKFMRSIIRRHFVCYITFLPTTYMLLYYTSRWPRYHSYARCD